MKRNRRVLIVGANTQIAAMFGRRGWDVLGDEGAKHVLPDLVQFTGGADVHPVLYHEERSPESFVNLDRDLHEVSVFAKYEGMVPMAGICRGGQFLHVMCGGRMFQDVDNHAIGGTHGVRNILTGKTFQATSTHHQMMRLPIGRDEEYSIIGVADPVRSTYANGQYSTDERTADHQDIEVVHWHRRNVLCFQPHPEYVAPEHELVDAYFSYLDLILKEKE